MKKFRFTLASVETVRSIRELKEREIFSMSVAKRVKAEEALQHALFELRELESLIVERRSGSFLVSEQIAFANEHMVRVQMVRDNEASLVKATAHMETCRESWIRSRRDLRLIENLEAKARGVHRSECEHEEQAQMDDRSGAVAGRPPLLES